MRFSELYKKLVTTFRLILESINLAFDALRLEKLRAFLSLLGVSIGIFAIVAIFTLIDSLEISISSGLDDLGGEVLYIQQTPWEIRSFEEWMEYLKYPKINIDDFNAIEENLEISATTSYFFTLYGRKSHYKQESYNYTYIVAQSSNLEELINVSVVKGRNISMAEYENGSAVTVIGSEVASELFKNEVDPIGKTIKVGALQVRVVGIFEDFGSSFVSAFPIDESVVMPIKYAGMRYNVRNQDGIIMCRADDNTQHKAMINEIRKILRAERRLSPVQKDNFSLNSLDFVKKMMEQAYKLLGMVGWVIGGFSLLIGGFGIANIMFVSVKERTRQIGIQKALGAKFYVIMLQFLVEAAVLSLFGGILGISLVYLLVHAVGSITIGSGQSLELNLTLTNIIQGASVSILIGIIAGMIPAYQAAKMDPVEAINS